MINEASLKRKFKNEAEKLGWLVTIIEQKSSSGTPDLVLGKDRKWVWIECKHWELPRTVLDKRNVKIAPHLFTRAKVQYETMRRLASAGPAYYVVFVTDGLGFVGSSIVGPNGIHLGADTFSVLSNKEILQDLENMI